MPIAIVWLYENRRFILESIAILTFSLVIWWYGFHNVKKIRDLETQNDNLIVQVKQRDAALNLLLTIGQDHAEIDKGSADNETKIRTGRKPGVRGEFISGGVLPDMFAAYSTAGTAAPVDAESAVRSTR